MRKKSQFPQISTRGYYDLDTGKKLKSNSYFLYPKKSFEKLYGKKELVIMIHGLRNNRDGALKKFQIARNKLKKLGYAYPVIGLSYDSNTKGAHLQKSELKALHAGQKIAKQNGANLSKFILDFKSKSPNTKIRLIGHSLGPEVILSTLQKLASKKNTNGIIESAYFFGASVKSNVVNPSNHGKVFQKTIHKNLKNYYAPTDEVLKYSDHKGYVKNPLGLNGASGKTISKYIEKKVKPQNHRFVSYAQILQKFP